MILKLRRNKKKNLKRKHFKQKFKLLKKKFRLLKFVQLTWVKKRKKCSTRRKTTLTRKRKNSKIWTTIKANQVVKVEILKNKKSLTTIFVISLLLILTLVQPKIGLNLTIQLLSQLCQENCRASLEGKVKMLICWFTGKLILRLIMYPKFHKFGKIKLTL